MAAEIKGKSDRDYEIEDACRTLLRAEEIKADPKLYKAAMEKVKEQHKAMMRVMDGGGMKLRKMLSKGSSEEEEY